MLLASASINPNPGVLAPVARSDVDADAETEAVDDRISLSEDDVFLQSINPKLPFDDAYYKADKIMQTLLRKENILDSVCVEPANMLAKYSRMPNTPELSSMFNEKMTNCGLVKVFDRSLIQFYNEDFFTKAEATEDGWNIEPIKSAHHICFYLTRCVWNASDVQLETCRQFWEETETLPLIMKLLSSDPRFQVPKFNQSSSIAWYAKSWISILNNVLRYYPDYAAKFRSMGGVQTVIPYITGAKNETMQAASANVVAYSVGEEQGDALKEASKAIDLLLHILKIAHKAKGNHRRCRGFSIPEVLQSLTVMAAMEDVKVTLSDDQTLGFLMQLLETNASEDEAKEVLQLLWTLTFNVQVRHQMKGSLEKFQETVQTFENHDNAAIRKAVQGILWNFGLSTEARPSTGKVLAEKGESNSRSHIMISYDWGHQPIVAQLNKYIKAAGYSTWLDVEQMSGSTLDAMALAVEKSYAVIICMSQRYKDSPNCRAEAEYSFRLSKPIIPIRTEKNYKADGWLGILMGTRLYFNCYTTGDIDTVLPKIAQEISQISGIVDTVAKPPSASSSKQSNHGVFISKQRKISLDSSATVKKWSDKKVQDWLKKKQLDGLSSKLSGFNGDMLHQLSVLYKTNAQLMLSLLNRLQIKDPKQILTLTAALDTLS